MNWRNLAQQLQSNLLKGIGTPFVIVALLAMMVLPLPAFLLDILFTFNIAFSLMILMVTIYARKPLDFAVFPTILLVATLLRLALNIASTRIILMEGHEGGAAAGHVIEAFGDFVIGGNYAVGLVVFAILIVINFMVVTKGAGRVAEVSARFALDSMPGKQMAIDADLNAGLITQDQAQSRRREVAAEAEFYGSMDGASKFVRGDAIAGIIILFINIIGGFIIGMAQHGLPFGQSIETYTTLTIGDGLVAQIPALLLSVAAALMITRSGEESEISQQISDQLLSNPKPLAISSGIMTLMGVIPGMPNVAFLTLAAITGAGAWWIVQREKKLASLPKTDTVAPPVDAAPKDLSWDDVQQVDVLGLEIGYRLIPMVDTSQDGQLLERIKGVRRKLSQELGFLVPSVHIRDNLELGPNQYSISMMGVTLGSGEVYHDRDLAINSGQVYGQVAGIATKDPTFGLDAVWIEKHNREQAQTLGYTVVDSGTVVATHLSQIIHDNSDELLGIEEVQQILNRMQVNAEKLVEEAKEIPLTLLVQVLQNLLREHISIRDMRTILETLVERIVQTKDLEQLTVHVRTALGKFILQNIPNLGDVVEVMTLDPNLEQVFVRATQGAPEGQLAVEPALAERVSQQIAQQAQQREMSGKPAILLVNPFIRTALARLFRYSIPSLIVLSYNEIPESRQINVFASIG